MQKTGGIEELQTAGQAGVQLTKSQKRPRLGKGAVESAGDLLEC